LIAFTKRSQTKSPTFPCSSWRISRKYGSYFRFDLYFYFF